MTNEQMTNEQRVIRHLSFVHLSLFIVRFFKGEERQWIFN